MEIKFVKIIRVEGESREITFNITQGTAGIYGLDEPEIIKSSLSSFC